MDISAVRSGLADAAATATSTPALICYGYVPDSIVVPAFFVAEFTQDFTASTYGRGTDRIEVTCRLLVGRADDRASQALLDGYLSSGNASSVVDALNGTVGVAQTLGGACHDAMVTRIQGYRFYEHAGTEYVGAELTVLVVGSGA